MQPTNNQVRCRLCSSPTFQCLNIHGRHLVGRNIHGRTLEMEMGMTGKTTPMGRTQDQQLTTRKLMPEVMASNLLTTARCCY